MAGKISGGDKLQRVEQAGMTFSAMIDAEYAEATCGGTGADIALHAAAPRHCGDARKRDDFQKWRIAECAELKNCFDNGTFLVCDGSEDGVKIKNCVFSYKAKTAQVGPTPIAQDYCACICMTKGARMYHKVNHIDTRIYRVREPASGKDPAVHLWKIDGSAQPSNLFTKALARPAFEKYRNTLKGIGCRA